MTIEQELRNQLAEIATIKDEDEWMKMAARREAIVQAAVRSADEILMANADGSVEEIDYLTAEVTSHFMHKVQCAMNARLNRKEFFNGHSEQILTARGVQENTNS